MASAVLPQQVPSSRRRWPADPRARWGLRAALAAPLVALAWWATDRGFVAPGHAEFLRLADRGGLAYPPVPVLLAQFLPAFGLCVVAAVFAAITLHRTGEQIVRRGFDGVVVAGLVLPVFAVPAVAYAASQSVSGIASLTLLAIALQGFVWFVVDGDTDGGFTCGLALAAAFLFDPVSVLYAPALGLATWFFAPDRRAAPASVLVIVFPTVFALLSWTFLEWRFGDVLLPELGGDPLTALGTVGMSLWHVPLFLAVAVLYAIRFPAALVGYLVSVLASVVAIWLGLRFTPVSAYVLFTLVALMSIPRDTGRRTAWALAAVGAVQVVLAWVWPPTSPGFEDWLAALTG